MGWQSPPFRSAAATAAMEMEASPQSTAQFQPSASAWLSSAFDGTLTWAAALGCNYLGDLSSLTHWMASFREAGPQPALCAPESGTAIHLRSNYQAPLPFSGADKEADSHDTVWYVLWVLQESLAEGVPWQSLGWRMGQARPFGEGDNRIRFVKGKWPLSKHSLPLLSGQLLCLGL